MLHTELSPDAQIFQQRMATATNSKQHSARGPEVLIDSSINDTDDMGGLTQRDTIDIGLFDSL